MAATTDISSESPESTSLFPEQSIQAILDCQFSSWYPRFASISIKSTIIKPLPPTFLEYLQADGVFIPKGANDSESESDSESTPPEEADEAPRPTFSFPDLDNKIRECLDEYGSVFPKLNWSSPKDSQWMLSTTEFMRCTSPADVYLALKASDLVQHDWNPATAFEGIEGIEEMPSLKNPESLYFLELVLRKWYPFDRTREVRCFVRAGVLLGISQREMMYTDYLNVKDTQATILDTVRTFWATKIKPKWGNDRNYVVDLLLTRNLQNAHVVDFNPFAPKTDSLLFTYEELRTKFVESLSSRPLFSGPSSSSASSVPDPNDSITSTAGIKAASSFVPELRVIDSHSHPMANVNAPLYQNNMLPLDVLALSHGQTGQGFAEQFAEAIQGANANVNSI